MAKSDYFDLSEAVNDIEKAKGASETSLASLSLIGKGLYNVGVFAVTEGLDRFMQNSGEKVLKNPSSTQEEKAAAEELIEFSKKRREDRKMEDDEWERERKNKLK